MDHYGYVVSLAMVFDHLQHPYDGHGGGGTTVIGPRCVVVLPHHLLLLWDTYCKVKGQGSKVTHPLTLCHQLADNKVI